MIYNEDSLTGLQRLPDECIDCVITSPPYWGLRDYGVPGQLGLESTIAEYISNMTEVFREVRRVLKGTGTLWLNMGDSYCGGGRAGNNPDYYGKHKMFGKTGWDPGIFGKPQPVPNGLKPKDLIGQPWRLAFALQADGWYLRSDIIWHKPNPMPESVTDRPTKSHEYLFLLSKQGQYFYDAEAVKESSGNNTHSKGNKLNPPIEAAGIGHKDWHKTTSGILPYRNRRTVWTVATQPFPEAHFATFPEKLVEPCIRAGTSERGNCAECGKPWVRVVKKTDPPRRGVNSAYPGGQTLATQKYKHDDSGPTRHTLGWGPSCSCGADTVRPIVLDPFMGSGTVGLMAKKLNRDYIGFELSSDYIEMAEQRIRGEMGLFVRSN